MHSLDDHDASMMVEHEEHLHPADAAPHGPHHTDTDANWSATSGPRQRPLVTMTDFDILIRLNNRCFVFELHVTVDAASMRSIQSHSLCADSLHLNEVHLIEVAPACTADMELTRFRFCRCAVTATPPFWTRHCR